MSPDLNDPKWTEYLLGELNGDEQQAAETLLAEHPGLRDDLNALRETLDLTRRALLEPVSGQETVTAACRAALETPPRRRPLLFIVPTALAAGLALLLGLNVFLNRDPGPALLLDEAGNEYGDLFHDGVITPFGLGVEAPLPEPAVLRESPVLERRSQPAPDSAPASPPAPARARAFLRAEPVLEATPEADLMDLQFNALESDPETEPEEDEEEDKDKNKESENSESQTNTDPLCSRPASHQQR